MNSRRSPFNQFTTTDLRHAAIATSVARRHDPDDDLTRVEIAVKSDSDGDFEMDAADGRVLRVYYTVTRDGFRLVEPEITLHAFDAETGEPDDLDDPDDLDAALRWAVCRWNTRYDD